MGVAIQTDVTGDLRHTQHSPREGNFVPTSSLVKSRRLRGVTIAGAAAVALAVVIPQASPAAAGHGGTATATADRGHCFQGPDLREPSGRPGGAPERRH